MLAEVASERPLIGAGSVEMKDLSALVGRNFPAAATFALFGGGIPEPGRHHVLALTLLINRAAYSYEDARAALSAAAAGKGDEIRAALNGADCLDIATNALFRANANGEHLRRDQNAPHVDKTELLSPSERKRLGRMRNFAEHVDEKIKGARSVSRAYLDGSVERSLTALSSPARRSRISSSASGSPGSNAWHGA
jgi:hypothetical protein